MRTDTNRRPNANKATSQANPTPRTATGPRTRILLAAATLALFAIAPSRTRAQNVELLGRIGGEVNALALQGNFVYIGEGYGMTVIDVTDPANPIRTGSVPLPGLALGVAVSGTVAYVADGSAGGLQIVEVSVPI